MEQYVGKTCKIRILSRNKELFFTAIVTEVGDLHISFIDKFNGAYTFLKSEVCEIQTKIMEESH
jgi:ethanolamine utilization microcompartment shell protein EutS